MARTLPELRVLIDKDLATINARAAQLGIGHIIVPTPNAVP